MSGTVEKALKVLELLSTYATPVRLADLSRELGMNKSTTYRMLEKMAQLGYVRQDEPNGRYMLTAKMWEVGVRAFRHFDIRAWARPYLEAIARETGETSVVAILDGQEVVIVDKCDTGQALQAFSPLGSRTPLHCSSLGKAFLMAAPERLLQDLRRPLKRFTPRTLTTLAGLRAATAAAVADGVTSAIDEYAEGVSGVAAPVRGVDGTALGVIGVTLPTIRAEGETLARARAVVRANAAELSRALGYAG